MKRDMGVIPAVIKIDLHMHSTVSDGTDNPQSFCERCGKPISACFP